MEPTWAFLGIIMPVIITGFNALIGLIKRTVLWDTIAKKMRTVKFATGTLFAYFLNIYFDGALTGEMLGAIPLAFVAGSWVGRKGTKALTTKEKT